MPAPKPHHDSASIASDLPCAHCSYNLRTAGLDGVCPECGRAVMDAVLHSLARPPRKYLLLQITGFALMNAAVIFLPGLGYAAVLLQPDQIDFPADLLVGPILLPLLVSAMSAIPVPAPKIVGLVFGVAVASFATWYCLQRAERPWLVPLWLLAFSVLQVMAAGGLIVVLSDG